MSTAKKLQWTSAGQSHAGTVREINEDAYLNWSERGLWAVADGMGGHEAGDVASRLIVDTLRQAASPADWDAFLQTVRVGLQEANRQLRLESMQHYQRRTIGSTVVVLLAYGSRGACLWAGDSRIYRWRGQQLQQLTRDHSHVQELVDHGLITAEQAQHHPLSNMITRAVGSSEELDIDILMFPLEPGDVFLLCSDGLTKCVSDPEIARLLATADVRDIVQKAEALALQREASDNVTTVAVRIDAVSS